MLLDKAKIASFTLYSDKPHIFKKASTYDSAFIGFFEVLEESADKYALLKQVKTTLERSEIHDVSIMANNDRNDTYVDHSTYYIYHNNSLQKINLKYKSINTLEPKEKVKQFLRSRTDATLNEETLVDLIRYLNS